MTKEFSILRQNSAILLMLFTVASLNSIATGNVLYSQDRDIIKANEDTRNDIINVTTDSNYEINNMILLQRLLELKQLGKRSGKPQDELLFFKYRHWYNKPRRKNKFHEGMMDNNQPTEVLISTQPYLLLPQIEALSRTPSQTNIEEVMLKTRQRPLPLIRKSRSASKYKHIFPFTFVEPNKKLSQTLEIRQGLLPSGSQTMEEMWGERSHKFVTMYHRSSSTVLQILSDGEIKGGHQRNIFAIMRITSVDYEEKRVVLKIYGEASRKYLALGSDGILYTTVNASNLETNFLHEYKANLFDSYLSQKHQRYVTLNNDGKPIKSRRVSGNESETPRRTRFLIQNISETLEAGLLDYRGTSSSTATKTQDNKHIHNTDDHGASFNHLSPSVTSATERKTSTETNSSPKQASIIGENVPTIRNRPLCNTLTEHQTTIPTTPRTKPRKKGFTGKQRKNKTRKIKGAKRENGRRKRRKLNRKRKNRRGKKRRYKRKKRLQRSVTEMWSSPHEESDILKLSEAPEKENILRNQYARLLNFKNFLASLSTANDIT